MFLSLLATLGCVPLQANSGVGGILEKIAAYMDRSAYRGIDTAYIAVPNEPWLVKLCGHMNETTYLMEAHMSLDPEVPSDYGLDFHRYRYLCRREDRLPRPRGGVEQIAA